MAQKYGFETTLRGPKRLDIWNGVTAADDARHLGAYVDLSSDKLPLEDGLILGWSRNMEEYHRLLSEGVPFMALRYNELDAERLASVQRLFRHCGLPVEQAAASLAAFDRDSQAGDIVSSEVAAKAMTDEQVARARALLSRRSSFNDATLRLPDIESL